MYRRNCTKGTTGGGGGWGGLGGGSLRVLAKE